MRVRRKRARRRAPLWAHLLDDGATLTLALTLTLTCSTTDPTPKTRTLISSWYTTSQACGPAGTSQQRPLTQMRSFITEGSETKVHACSWSNRLRCQRAEYLKPKGSEPEPAHRTSHVSQA